MKKSIVFLVSVVVGFNSCGALYAQGLPLSLDQLGKPEHYHFTQQVNKVVIWGHKLHSHTHSYIHYAFDKAFRHLGYDTYWFDNTDDVRMFDFTGSLFLTEGQADAKMPIRDDCFYILHNCDPKKYQAIQDKCIILQVYTDDVLNRPVKAFDEFMLYDVVGRIIYMPFATDLLPDEIEENRKKIKTIKKEHRSYFVGTVGGGTFGNIDQLTPFRVACEENGVAFQTKFGGDMQANIELLQNSYVAPAIMGKWQCEVGIITCRIFKNISYGLMGITNSSAASKLFHGKIVYNPDTYQLFYDAQKRLKALELKELYELMDFVQTKHTYLSRIDCLFKFMDIVVYGKDDSDE